MGFFSSIGSVLGGIGGALLAPVTGGASIGIGAGLGGVLGSGLDERKTDKRYNQQMSLSQAQMQFQQDYVKNAMQWRAEDAKKAGFHPMAALGFSSPQYSGVSFPSIPNDTQAIDPTEFGQSLNYAATKAKDRKQQAQMIDLQIRGLELDNEFKQAQIDALKVDTLASSIASNQAWQSPANPTLNAKEPTNGLSPDMSISPTTQPLLGAARVGNSVLLHINPDISDSLTEDMTRNIIANIAAEAQMGRIAPEILKHFSEREKAAVARGDAVIEYSPPSQFFFRWKGHMRPHKNSDGSVSGKITF